MLSLPIFLFSVILIQVSIPTAFCSDEDPWLEETFQGVTTLRMIPTLTNWMCYNDQFRFDCYVPLRLREWLPKLKDFLTLPEANLKKKVTYNEYEKRLFQLSQSYALRGLIGSKLIDEIETYFIDRKTLKEKYVADVKPLFKTLKEDVSKKAHVSPWLSDPYALNLKKACASLPARNVPTLSVKDVCPTLSQCSSSFHSRLSKNACRESNKCDVTKAIPMMIGMLFYKVSFAFVDKFCSSRCGDNGCNMEAQIASIEKDVDLIYAFLLMRPEKPFEQFYRDFVRRRAFSQIGAAMEIISKQEDKLSAARFACEEIQAEPGCKIMRFYPNYLLLKKIKEERLSPKDTRDLTLYENVDNTKMIQLKTEVIKHTELLGAVHQLNSNLEAQVKGISSYFKGIASFDQGIANADVKFIKGSLKKFNTKYTTLQAKLNKDIEDAMTAMKVMLSVQLVEETIALVAKVIAEANPIKAIFTGVDTKGVRDQAKAVAKSAAQLAHGISLFEHLGGLAKDTTTIATDLQDNQRQIASLITLVNKIKNNQADDIDDDAETFIQQYAGYTPKVDRSRMAQNIAMWGAFKGSTCDLLNGVEGIGASIGKGVANGHLLCEKLEGTIAEFGALRENIFGFQFELVGSLARVVRGNVNKKLAESIGGQQNEMFKAEELLGGFLMVQNFIQSQAWLYCDKLEYKNEGQRIQPCSPETGLFTNSDLDNLVAFTDHQTYISIERTVHIPSKPQFNGDLGFINIQSFAREKTTSFRLPLNVNWLYKFDWSLIGESQAPYVENFQLFLPNKEYKTGLKKIKTSTRILVTADTETGSYISANRESSVLYKLPEMQTSYVTVYQEGYRSSTCSKEISNPYSLCNNLPKICHTSTNVPGDSLLPTTLSRWRVTYNVQSGEEDVQWLAPNSATDLYFIAKVTLRMLPRKSSRSGLPKPADQADVCCEGNTYRSSLVSSACKSCPSGSTSNLGGYYCEADAPVPKKKQDAFQHGDALKNSPSTKDRASSRASKIRRPNGHPRTRQAHDSNNFDKKIYKLQT